MKIAVVVHGRFHAFDLARELTKLGHDVHVFSNYPKFVMRQFGISDTRSTNFVLHGLATRIASRLPFGPLAALESFAHRMFGRWAARRLLRESWDAVCVFSGVAEEIFVEMRRRRSSALAVLHRGSSHIRFQKRLLEDSDLTSAKAEIPSAWMVAREEREYMLSDAIHVLSSFAHDSFVKEGVDPLKLMRIQLGVETARFECSEDLAHERCRRIESGAPLRVLSVGTFCRRKGAEDLQQIVATCNGLNIRFRHVGMIAADARAIHRDLASSVEFRGKRPHYQLPDEYAWADCFLFPTLEDGFGAVLCQSLASGVPVLATTNCGAPDLVEEGMTGWILPIKTPKRFAAQLMWCLENRPLYAQMTTRVFERRGRWDWSQTARQAEANISAALDRVRKERVAGVGSSSLSSGVDVGV